MVYILYRTHSLQFRYKRIGGRLYPAHILIKEAQIILHEADEPNLVSDLSNPYRLARKDRTEVDAERRAIMRALSHCNENIPDAASLLGITRPTLCSLLDQLGLKSQD